MAEVYRPGGLSPRDGGVSGQGPGYDPVLPDEEKTRVQLNRMNRGIRKLKLRALMGWLVVLLAAVIISFTVNLFFSIVPVEGPSMLPTLHTGERVLVNRMAFAGGTLPKRSDVVICKYPDDDRTYVKRVIGKPGEKVEIKGGVVYVDGVPVTLELEKAENDMPTVSVPDGHVFVIGDNRNDSKDSRNPKIGSIPYGAILGRVLAIVWPLDSARFFDKYD